ncbi:hypothetical protein OROHE_025276 [Orobanche hederae]
MTPFFPPVTLPPKLSLLFPTRDTPSQVLSLFSHSLYGDECLQLNHKKNKIPPAIQPYNNIAAKISHRKIVNLRRKIVSPAKLLIGNSVIGVLNVLFQPLVIVGSEKMANTSEFSTDQVFRSREDLMTWVQNVARSQGYVIVTKRSKAITIGFISKIVLGCDRGGISKGFPQQWRYDAHHRLLRLFCFPQYRRSSSAAPAQVCLEQPTTEKAPASSTPDFDSHAYARMLQLCTRNNDTSRARIIHCEILKRGNCLDLYARNILLNLHLKTGHLSNGLKVFDEMPERNVVSFVTMIQGYSQSKEYDKAVNLFFRAHKEGHDLNHFVFTSVLKLLVSMDWLELALCVHASIHKLGYGSNAFVGTSLIDAYSVFGVVDFAKEVFEGIAEKDMVCWTGMVFCYAENDCYEDSLALFNQIRSKGLLPNNYTFASVIKACLGLGNSDLGKSIHGCVVKTCYEMDPYVGVSLLDLHTRSGDIDDARCVFEEIPKDNVVPWSFMISRYSQSDCCQQALDMFLEMRREFVSPNQFTLASVLPLF